MTASELHELRTRWRSQVCGTTSVYAKGVLIWISPGVSFELVTHKVDVEGQYVVVECCLDGASLVLLTIYAPNAGHLIFLDCLTLTLLQDPHIPIVWDGRL